MQIQEMKDSPLKMQSHRNKGNLHSRREARAFWIFILPWIFGFIAFNGGPILASLGLSFAKYNVVKPPRFAGLENYLFLAQNPMFYKSITVTIYYVALAVPFTNFMAIMIALLLNRRIKGQPFFRTAFYLPSIVSGASIAFLWKWLLNPEFGVVNSLLLQWFGIKGPLWFNSSAMVVPSLVLMQLTALGGIMVIYLASLQSLPIELYEAASIDGASRVRMFTKITVPLISPVILFNTITGIIGSFQIFTQAYIITRGGPNFNSFFYIYYLYQTAFADFNMGYASALAWVLFILIFILTLLMLWVSKRMVYYEYEKR